MYELLEVREALWTAGAAAELAGLLSVCVEARRDFGLPATLASLAQAGLGVCFPMFHGLSLNGIDLCCLLNLPSSRCYSKRCSLRSELHSLTAGLCACMTGGMYGSSIAAEEQLVAV